VKLIDKDVYGPWALVTGASSGIGEEFARQAAASGIKAHRSTSARPCTPSWARRAQNRATTVTRAELAAGCQAIKEAVAEAAQARPAAAQPAP
jgi:NADP-dependent 3-hydroxy acid dehydrogenase YdfG